MTSHEGFPSILDTLPTELILAIGKVLDGPSLISSLQVCKQWHQVLFPLVWCSISKAQWNHPSFPIQQQRNKYFMDEDEVRPPPPTLPPSLKLVRSLEWHCNITIRARAASDPIDPFTALEQQRSGIFITRVLEATHYLTSLSLVMGNSRSRAGRVFKVVRGLKHLRRLSIDLRTFPNSFQKVAVGTLYPMILQLEELSVRGDWCHIFKMVAAPVVVLGGQESESAPQEQEPCWRMRKLSLMIDKVGRSQSPLEPVVDDPFVSFELDPESDPEPDVHSSAIHMAAPSFSLLPVLNCPNLQELTLAGADDLDDVVEALSSLRCLRTLEISVGVQHFAFLVQPTSTNNGTQPSLQAPTPQSSSREQTGLQETSMALPGVEHLTIRNVVSGEPAIYRQYFSTFLRTWPLLKTFVVNNFAIDPRIMFAQQPGRETEDGWWACTGLETLSIRLPWARPSDDIERERKEVWRPMYRQLGQLTKLRSLTIHCTNLDKSVEAGFGQLAEATSLERLTVVDPSVRAWSRVDAENLVRGLGPKLKLLRLPRLQPVDYELLNGYLKEGGRSDVFLKVLKVRH
ncbi:hypothetical protein BGX33_009083 [Mortierella sp. NVP41]|nr:hypothetical protein BGX33_009083 [Mortierella sp. NVP41]